MSDPFISFQASDLDPTQLNELLSQYLAYQKLRAFRSHLIWKFGLFVLIASIFSLELHLLPIAGLVTSVSIVVAVMGATVRAERRARRIFMTFLRRSGVSREHA